jgi:RNA polymerase sigma-70 factor (ECF subfamily)
VDFAIGFDSTPAQDGGGVARLVDAHGTMLYRFCRKLTFSKEDAEDLFQETWLRVLRSPGKLLRAESPQSFLCAAALSLWKSRQRKYARRGRIAPEQPPDEFLADSGESPEEAMLRRAEQELMQSLVDQLPEKLRTPLIMRYTLELDVAEIAGALHLPPGTVKSRLFYARQEIKKGWQTDENT